MRKTKIICTLGPATKDEEVVRALMLNGMNVARFNFSHGDYAQHETNMEMIKKLRTELNLPIATLLDTKGPEIRIGNFKNKKVTLQQDNLFILTTDDILGDENKVSVSYKNLPKDIHIGSKVLLDDGLIELKVVNIEGNEIVCKVINGGDISDHKGVNIPGHALSMPYMSEKDRNDIIFGIKHEFDFIAASFTRCADDIMQIRQILDEYKCTTMRIIAKIENADGVANIDDILRVSDGIMVARGDMGVEIPYEEIPVLQKILIKKGYKAGKQVITATQMLESMIHNPRPTRAETTDIANAIYDGTSAIMLSGETAAGDYPVEALKAMALIAERTENDIDYGKRFSAHGNDSSQDVTNAISHATCTVAYDLGAKAIVTVTQSGQTARMISKFRPQVPIIGCSAIPAVYRQMNLSWGVVPLMIETKTNIDDLFEHAADAARKAGYVKDGDLIAITCGAPLGISGTTNLLKVHVVGDILVTGRGVTSGTTCGKVCACRDVEEALKKFNQGDILVIPETDNRILSLMKKCSGIITEEDGLSSHAAIVGMALDIPVIIGAKNATRILKSGTTIRIDASKGLVSNGALKEGLTDK